MPLFTPELCLLQLPMLVDSRQLQSEVQRLLKKKHSSRLAKLEVGLQGAGQQQVAVLLAWCQAVCGCYDVSVYNFTSCFADARALCLLVGRSLLSSHC